MMWTVLCTSKLPESHTILWGSRPQGPRSVDGVVRFGCQNRTRYTACALATTEVRAQYEFSQSAVSLTLFTHTNVDRTRQPVPKVHHSGQCGAVGAHRSASYSRRHTMSRGE